MARVGAEFAGKVSLDNTSAQPDDARTALFTGLEREYIASILARHQGRIDSAAAALGVERANLYRKMRQLGIRGPSA